jgi:hypothetical protein
MPIQPAAARPTALAVTAGIKRPPPHSDEEFRNSSDWANLSPARV